MSRSNTPGPRMLKDTNSTDYALQTWHYVKTCYESVGITEARFNEALEEAEQYRIYERIPPGYKSLDDLAEADLGIPLKQARTNKRVQMAAQQTTEDAVPERQGQRTDLGNFPMSSQADRASQSGISDRTQRKLDHLARYAPDLLDAVRDSTLSADAAYRQARGKPQMVSIPLDVNGAVRALCRKFTIEDLHRLVELLAERIAVDV